jgi:RimJ/RimL family protein N-acetyltransferase
MILQKDKTLYTPRLNIEPLLEAHAVSLFDILLDKNIYRFISEKPPVNLSALKSRYRLLEKRKAPLSNELWLNWALKLKDNERYIGTLQATIYENGTANIAYVLASAFWKKGLAFESCKQLLEFLFSEYHIKKAIAEVDVNNNQSQQLLERLGFTKLKNQKSDEDFSYQLTAEIFQIKHSI